MLSLHKRQLYNANMSELADTAYPFRHILGNLTSEVVERGLDPFEAYIRFREHCDEAGLRIDDYCGSSVTSGGHARNSSLAMNKIVEANTQTALAVCDELYSLGQLSPRTAVEAVSVGNTGWKQSGYMPFWLLVMSGIRGTGHGVAQRINNFRNELDAAVANHDFLDMDVYDSKAPADIRAPHYFMHAQLFAQVIQRYQPEPVRRMIRLIDPDISLGQQAENVFGRLMGTDIFKVALAATGISPHPSVLPQPLRHDVPALIQYGATVFDTRPGFQFVIVKQPVEAAV